MLEVYSWTADSSNCGTSRRVLVLPISHNQSSKANWHLCAHRTWVFGCFCSRIVRSFLNWHHTLPRCLSVSYLLATEICQCAQCSAESTSHTVPGALNRNEIILWVMDSFIGGASCNIRCKIKTWSVLFYWRKSMVVRLFLPLLFSEWWHPLS